MRILKWEVKGWAGVDSVSIINPSPHLVEFFSRENGEGKSSLLESLSGALGGAKAIGYGVIREGATKAEVKLDLGECLVSCSVSQKGRNLSVKTADGKPIPEAQTYLNGKVGKLLDPGTFRAMSDEDKSKLLRGLAGEEWAAKRAELAADHKAACEARLEAGRAVKRLGELQPVEKAKPVDVAALAKTLQEANEHNSAERDRLQAWNREQEKRAEALQMANAALESNRETIERFEKQLAELKANKATLEHKRECLPTPETDPPADNTRDTSAIRAELDQANARNSAATAYQRYLDRKAEHEKVAKMHGDAEVAVVRAVEALEAHDREAKLPEGITLTGDGVFFDGRPLGRMSTGECLTLAFKVATHLGQEILRLDNAEVLGPTNMETICRLAVEHNVQLVLATRGTPHTSGAYELRNGRLVMDAVD